MNSLSLFIYIAGIISNISGVFLFITIVLGVFLGICILGAFAAIADGDTDSKGYAICNSTRNKILWPFIAMAIVTALIPSQTTMYMIAASEMGEEVIKTEEFDKVKSLVNKYLDEALNESSE